MAILWITINLIWIMIKKTHINPSKMLANSRHLLKFGHYGFKILTNTRLTSLQLTSLNRILNRKLKSLPTRTKNYKLWFFSAPNKTLTKLNLESRMGKGKGSIFTEAVFLKKGTIIYEFQNIKYQQIVEVFEFFNNHLSAKLMLVSRK